MKPLDALRSQQSDDEPLGIFQRRKIEAEIIKPIYTVLKREFGLEKAKQIIAEAISQSAFAAGREFAEKEPNGTSMTSFVALQYLWKKDDALISKVQVNTPTRYDYVVTRCRYAELYREMGLGEIGALLSCNRDNVFIEAYAPEIKLTRPHTLMNGDAYCDFSYVDTRATQEKP